MPTIVFQVNLSTVLEGSNRQPFTRTESSGLSQSRSTWFPDQLIDNRKLKHGDQFSVSGTNALYLRDNYTSGDYKFLDVVSVTA